MPLQLFTNNAQSQLSGVLPQGGTTLVCTASHGSRFPTPSAGNFFYLTIFIKDTYGVEQQSEIVKVTARIGDVFTIVRDIETITGQSGGYAYDATTDPVFLEVRWTAGCVNNLLQKGEAAIVAASGSYSDLINTPNFGTAAFLAGPVAGNATATELVKGNDTRLSNSRVASDVPAWAKEVLKPSYTKSEVGLSNVDNTSDASKPVSTAQATAIGLKQDTLVSATNIKTVGGISLLGSGNIALPTGDVTLTGVQVLTNKTITGLKEVKVAIAASEINLSSGNFFDKTITALTTFTVANVPATGTVASIILELTNGGAFTITWWTGMKWSGGVAPTLTAAGRDVLGFYTHDGGTTWTGWVLSKDVK